MLNNYRYFKPHRATPSVLASLNENNPLNLHACIKLIFEVDTFNYPMAKAGGLR
jgi:hypothetical protein